MWQRCLLCCLLAAPAVRAADWPQLLGMERDGHSSETGLLKKWPADGPAKAWERSVGAGFSGPAVAGGKLILFHRVGSDEIVECLDAKSGKAQWKYTSPTGYVDDFGFDEGPRATPIIAAGRVFILGAEGRLTCLDFAKGDKIWSRDLAADYPFRKGFFGVGASPLVDADRVFVNVGAKGAGIVAFDAKSGKELWKATNDRAGYSTPTIAAIGGRKRLLFVTRDNLLVLDPSDGSIAHRREFHSRNPNSVNAASPLFADGQIFLSASYDTGALLLNSDGWKDVWQNDESLSNHYNTSVKVGGHLFGIHGRQEYGAELRCVEWKTGKVVWQKASFGCASLIAAAGMLIAAIESGELALLEATPKGYTELGRFAALTKPLRAAPALSDGLLFVRDSKTLAAWKLKKE